MIFTDTHAHLHFEDFTAGASDALQRAREAGVSRFMIVGTNRECSARAAAFAQAQPDCFAAAGCHPHDAKDYESAHLEEYRLLLKHPKVRAIGEIGLDFFRNLSAPEKQEAVLRDFIQLHKETGLAMILHVRDAHAAIFRVLTAELKPPIRAVFHCHSADEENTRRAVDLGLWISYAGNITYKKNEVLRRTVPLVPLDKIVLETDCPYLPPEGLRGKRNEPAFMVETARCVAGLLGIPAETLARQAHENAACLFGLS